MSTAAKFQRDGDGWRFYLNDFPEVPAGFDNGPVMPAFASLSLHFDRGVPLIVNRINVGQEREFWTLGYEHAHIYFGVDQARQLRDTLDALFSAGASEDADGLPPDASVTPVVTAPAEPRGQNYPDLWNRFPTQEFE